MIDIVRYSRSLINMELLAEIINNDFLPLFNLEFTEFEWKSGKMYKMIKGNNTLISTCFDNGLMFLAVKSLTNYETFVQEYIHVARIIVDIDREKYSINDIQKEILNIIVDFNWEEDMFPMVIKLKSNNLVFYPTMPLTMERLSGDKPLKYYNINTCNIRDFNVICGALEDLSLIPLYMSEEG